MNRSACLPEPARLDALLRGLRTPPAPKRRASPSAHPTAPPPLPAALLGPAAAPPAPAKNGSERPGAGPQPEELLADLAENLAGIRSLDRRFAVVARWLEVRVPAKHAFVTDADGLAMVDSSMKEGYFAAAGELGVTYARLAAQVPDFEEGSTTLRLRGSGSVELVGCSTELGRFNVGVVVDRPLGSTWISIIRSAVTRAVLTDTEAG